MNKRMVAYIIGVLLLAIAVLMLLPAIVAVIYSEWHALYSFLFSCAISGAVGGLLVLLKPAKMTIHSREGFAAVALGWLFVSVAGALPFIISGEIPSFVDALFESVSGFTTTGASILSDVEALSKSILFWRSFTHWVGGMGVLVFVIAALPLASGGGDIHLLRAESPGPDVSKLVPSSRGTAFRLYSLYLAITVVEIIALLICGNGLFDALTLSFGTAGTGGFGIRNTSLAEYSAATQIVVTVFMTAFGVNFSCYFLLLGKKFKDFFKHEELRAYFGILITAILIIAINIRGVYSNFGQALQASAFQAASVMTTTGFTTVDFNAWPELSRMVMILIMCVGACVGSTGGGIKVARVVILVKEGFRQLKRAVVPGKVESVRFNGKTVNETMITGITSFFMLYMLVFVLSVFLLSFDTKDTVSNISGVIATLNNIGPGLEIVGAKGNYGGYTVVSKLVFIFDMLAGRLELLPVLALFYFRTWRD